MSNDPLPRSGEVPYRKLCKVRQASSRLKAASRVPINAGAMALRLTDPAPSQRPDAAGTAPLAASPSPAALLVPQAQAALAERDLARYLALFTQAAAVEDLHRRYEARKHLIECGLAGGGTNVRTLAPAFAAVARAAVDVLEEEPREPELLTYAGVAFYELGELVTAEKLFDAALRLDADSPHATRNLREIARRRKTGLTVVDLPKSTAVAVRQLVPRAARVAAAAVPATDKRISLCMIVKDEEGMLGRCLGAVVDHVDEIIVVDTGSTDRTVEIAEAFGARVLHHAWTGDFAAARNVSLDAATGDWVLYLDADEVLVDGDGPRLRALAGHTWREAIYLVETNHTGELEDGTAVMHNALRLFRRRPEYRFEGRLHEQFAHRLPGFLPERIEASDVRIDHFGYLGAVRDAKEKSRRNIELVRRQIAEGEPTPFLHFNLGSELAAAGEPHAALVEFRAAWDKLDLSDGARSQNFVPSLAGRLVRTLGWVGELDEARERSAQALELFPEYTDLVLEQASIARRTGDDAEAERLLRRCLEMGDAPSRLSPMVGAGTYLAQLALADLLRATGRLDQADELVQACLAEHPRFLGSIEPYATIRLKAGAAPPDVVAAVDAIVGELSPGARFMLAVALHEAGAFAEAEEQLRAVVAARSDSAPARMAHAEVLLCLGRFGEAAAAVEGLDDAPGVARARILALLADGRTDDAAAALGAAPDLLAEAAPAVVAMLDTLVVAEAFEAFEALATLLDASDVPWRERRELLAGVYLRHGYLDSAADEWMLVCREQGPDVPALLGLAQVAWAHGLDDDATVFAQEVLALSPDHPGASALLEHLAAQATV